jgi:hypothetical protein
MATKSKTGSEKMRGAGRGFSAAKIRALVAVLKKYKLSKDIIIDGKPQPDFIHGRFTARDSAVVLDVLRATMKVGGRYKPIRLFPEGQPPIIDQIDVEIPGIRPS